MDGLKIDTNFSGSSSTENSSRRLAGSLSGGSLKTKSNAELIDELAVKINEIRKQRLEMDHKYTNSKAKKKKADPNRHKFKLEFHHPNLEYVYGQVLYSPYLTKPLDPYPEKTLKGVDKLNELKSKGYYKFEDIPEEERPYDVKQAKKEFIKEVIKYHPSYLATDVRRIIYILCTKV